MGVNGENDSYMVRWLKRPFLPDGRRRKAFILELVYGGQYGDANLDGKNPRPLCDMASEHGIEQLLVIGLANDEIGYIVPPSDFLVNDELPYLERIRDKKGEDHYEETNSVGSACAGKIAEAFEAALNVRP